MAPSIVKKINETELQRTAKERKKQNLCPGKRDARTHTGRLARTPVVFAASTLLAPLLQHFHTNTQPADSRTRHTDTHTLTHWRVRHKSCLLLGNP